uniref:Secreted protein n=1 Tax=Haemonchus contortus TaxID=6289 RepID=A0A7I4XZZ8_HAECO
MMLITLTILLPLVHTVAGTECQATPMKTVHNSILPIPIKEQLQNDGYIISNNQTTFAVYYDGFPDVLKPDRFMAACVAGLKNSPDRHCVNITYINGEKRGHNIAEKEFQMFHQYCHNVILPNSHKVKPEEDDDHDTGKDASELEHEELGEAAGEGN